MASATSISPARSQKAISGSIIQNSAAWRWVLEFSARKVGPKVYTSPKAMAKFSAFSWPDTVRLVFFAEEVLAVIHLPVFGPGNVVQIQGGHLKHLAGAFAVGAGDDGGVDIYEATALEELVDGGGRHAADPEGGGEQVGAGPQMLDGPQELHAVALFLQGIVRGGLALHLDRRRPLPPEAAWPPASAPRRPGRSGRRPRSARRSPYNYSAHQRT